MKATPAVRSIRIAGVDGSGGVFKGRARLLEGLSHTSFFGPAGPAYTPRTTGRGTERLPVCSFDCSPA